MQAHQQLQIVGLTILYQQPYRVTVSVDSGPNTHEPVQQALSIARCMGTIASARLRVNRHCGQRSIDELAAALQQQKRRCTIGASPWPISISASRRQAMGPLPVEARRQWPRRVHRPSVRSGPALNLFLDTRPRDAGRKALQPLLRVLAQSRHARPRTLNAFLLANFVPAGARFDCTACCIISAIVVHID
jgi:hypothetical protein